MIETQTKLYFEDVEVGDALSTLTKPPVTHNMFVRYSGASGDFNPLHTDPAVGLAGGTGGVIAHGMLIMGFLGHFVSDYLGGPLPLSRFGVRFQSMTRIGDVITCSGTVTKKYEADEPGFGFIEVAIAATDATGDKKASGSFVAKLPKRS
jgi:acyl dehydratase